MNNLSTAELFLIRAEWWTIKNASERFDYLDAVLKAGFTQPLLDRAAAQYGFPENNKIKDWEECTEVHMWSDLIMANVFVQG